MERDFFAWLTVLSTITTGLVLAVAALFAYVIQRARYLNEIEPDLRISDVKLMTLFMPGEFPSMAGFLFDYSVTNASSAPATNVRATLRLSTKFMEASSVRPFFEKKATLQGEPITIDTDEIRPQRTWPASHTLPIDLPALDAAFSRHFYYATVDMTFYSRPQLVIFLMRPWAGMRKRYTRTFEISWRLEYQSAAGGPKILPKWIQREPDPPAK